MKQEKTTEKEKSKTKTKAKKLATKMLQF